MCGWNCRGDNFRQPRIGLQSISSSYASGFDRPAFEYTDSGVYAAYLDSGWIWSENP
jgi:hypothetical protein